MSDINVMRQFLLSVKPDEKVIELRLDSKDEVSGRVTRLHGHYNDKDKALEVAAGWKGSVYINVNQLAADHPAPNCLTGAKRGECTKATDIVPAPPYISTSIRFGNRAHHLRMSNTQRQLNTLNSLRHNSGKGGASRN